MYDHRNWMIYYWNYLTKKTRYHNILRKRKGEEAGHKTNKLLHLSPNKKGKSPYKQHMDMNKI